MLLNTYCAKNLNGENSQPFYNNLPIMLALCLMFSSTYYAKNYADIISLGLLWLSID